jgi:BirA family biotin operon repressor/biotin-[acetyl-CoA-carboxylase] ligase
MPKLSFQRAALQPFLPDTLAKGGCCALTEGFGEHASAFALEALGGEDGLLGPALPASASFFDVPAPVYLCDQVTSTFAVAHALAQEGRLPAWGAVLAACQTAGRGQFGRQWQSLRGNLHVTFRLPASPLLNSSAAPLLTGVLLAMALNKLGYPVRLKWPNDLLNQEQEKAAGILLEARGGVLLAGVGVNLRQLPEAPQLRLDHAASPGLLRDAAGQPAGLTPFALWQALLGEMISLFDQTFSGVGAEALPGLVEPFLAWRGETVHVSDAGGTVQSGWLGGVSPAGGLLLTTFDGSSHEVFRGSLVRA